MGILEAFENGTLLALPSLSVCNKRFVYVLKTRGAHTEFYVGVTSDVNARLAAHNTGDCHSRRSTTAVATPFGPWVSAMKRQALRFERYLKSGLAISFARRHFESVLWRALFVKRVAGKIDGVGEVLVAWDEARRAVTVSRSCSGTTRNVPMTASVRLSSPSKS